MSLSKLSIDLSANIAKFESDMGRAARISQKRTKQMKRDAKIAGRAISAAFVGVGVAMAAMVKRTTAVADQMQKLSLRTGISTKALSEYKHATELSGLSFEQWTNGVKRMQRALSDADVGLSTQVRAFDRLGISVDELMKLEPDQQFEAIAEAMSGMESATLKSATAQEIFGRAGTEMLSMMANGRKGIQEMRKEAERFGLSIGQDFADKAALFNDNMTRFGAQFEAMQLQLVGGLLPALIQIQEHFLSSGTAASDAADAGEEFGAFLKGVLAVLIVAKNATYAFTKALVGLSSLIFNSFKAVLAPLSGAINSIVTAMEDLSQGNFKAAAASIGRMGRLIGSDWSEAQRNVETAVGFIADEAFGDLTNGLSEAQELLASTGESFSKLTGPAEEASNDITLVFATLDERTGEFTGRIKAVKDSLTTSFADLDAIGEFEASLQSLLDTLYPVQAAGRALGDDLALLTKAYEGGSISLAQYQDAVTRATAAFNGSEAVVDAMEDVNRSATSAFTSFLDNTQSAKAAFKDFADSITQMAIKLFAQKAIMALFGGMGGGGGGLGGIVSSIFGGGLATGGTAMPGKLYEVNEKVPEIFDTGTKQFMMTPSGGGKVTPMGLAAGTGGNNVTVHIDARESDNPGRLLALIPIIQSQVEQSLTLKLRRGYL